MLCFDHFVMPNDKPLSPNAREIAGSVTRTPRANAGDLGGVPCLRGLRIPVATVVSLVAEGQTTEGILALYPDLEADDVREALLFAAEAVRAAGANRLGFAPAVLRD